MKKWFAMASVVLLAACGAGSAADGTGAINGACSAGATRTCSCEAGTSGTQTCSAEGAGWSVCQCKTGDAGPIFDASFDKADVAASCGDGTCDENDGEDCQTCPIDCLACAKCDYAPSCSDTTAVIPPVSATALASFNNNGSDNYSSSEPNATPLKQTNCQGPRLQLRVKELTVHDTGNYSAGGLGGANSINVLCSVLVQEGVASPNSVEFIVTPQLTNVDKGQTKQYTPLLATFWGQDPSSMTTPLDGGATTPSVSLPRLTQKGLQISYQCYAADDPSTFNAVLGAITSAAGGIATIPGNPYGWAFGLGAGAGAALQSLFGSSSGIQQRLTVNQQIDENALLDLTNGREWHIRQKGNVSYTFDDHEWDFDLTIQSWGCSLKSLNSAH